MTVRPQRSGAAFPLGGTKWLAPVKSVSAVQSSAPRASTDSSLFLAAREFQRSGTWLERGASIVRDSELQVQGISTLYDFVRRDEVVQFLGAYPFLAPLLIEARRKIAEVFGHASRVVLEVITDPEAPADRELFAFVQADLPPDEALQKLNQLDQEWWLDKIDEAQGKLCIHVEFQ
ncbi:MAG: hypothetical protein H5T65_07895 [Chloroflexi bacterium]|nr:hypothetical protein [Chloroflexota bacterium]